MLRGYAYTSRHVEVSRHRARWFEKMDRANYCLWWVPAGYLPTGVEGHERLDHYRLHGSTAHAFWSSQRVDASLTVTPSI